MKLYAHKSGIERKADSKTLTGAKREATKWMCHGGGSVSVLDDDNNALSFREFWENGSRFGWKKWQNI